MKESYTTHASATSNSDVTLKSVAYNDTITPPPQFGGENEHPSPEDLFSAAISSCYILTLKSIAKHKKLKWDNVEVECHANLEKKETGLAFHTAELKVTLYIPKGQSLPEYIELLHKAEKFCLVSASLKTDIKLYPKVKFSIS